jgi:hypothetical protein
MVLPSAGRIRLVLAGTLNYGVSAFFIHAFSRVPEFSDTLFHLWTMNPLLSIRESIEGPRPQYPPLNLKSGKKSKFVTFAKANLYNLLN